MRQRRRALPWKTRTPVDLRMEIMKRLVGGERISDLCREYGISRKTGDKFKQRFKRLGVAGLQQRSSAPNVIPHKTSAELADVIVAARKQHPTWGGKKLKEVLEKQHQRVFPAVSTIGEILLRNGLVERRRRRPNHRSTPTALREAHAPNDIWCVDYKGQFRLGDRTYCYPLTLTDQFSRFILGCEGMAAIADEAARDSSEEIFSTYGLPNVMRSDNGVPFASTGLAGLTRLSVYWLRLGIVLERIRPAHPEENGRHERMHRTLKAETARPARSNLLQQQERFDQFVEEFNSERPHEALAMKCPAEVYTSSLKPYPAKIPDLSYPTHDDTIIINRFGQVNVSGIGQVHVTRALSGQPVGLREARDGRWLVTFMNIDLGHAHRGRTFVPIDAPHPPEAS
jgi:transposase InsO family protein